MHKILRNDNETLMVADFNGKIVGWILFHSQSRKRFAHVGSFGMMIAKDYRENGIWQLLIQSLLNWAEKHPVIEKVCLGVFSTNHRAIALYKKMGFSEEGRKI